ncbi:glycosyltransferase [Candidatus Margulisiibacteriota bacterium]
MKKKILYLFSDTGGGHRAAANALIAAVKKLRGDEVDQQMVDVFVSGGGLNAFLAKSYAPMIKYASFLWKILWYGTNNKLMLKLLENVSAPFTMKKLVKLFKSESPDVIVSVHPLLNHLSLEAIKKTGRKTPFITVGMDPVDLHLAWVHKDADAIAVATDEAKEICLREGVPSDKVKVLGLPVKPGFSEKGDKIEIRKKIGLDKDLFTVLIMGGGEGAGNIFDLADKLDRSDISMQLIVICGRNKDLEAKLNARRFRFPVKIFGFTEEVPMVMNASDLVVTKGGPGAVFEAIAQELPMIVTNWLPGQEEGNIRYVKEHKIGIIEKDSGKISEAIKQVVAGGRYAAMKENIIKIKRPDSVFDIANLILSYI